MIITLIRMATYGLLAACALVAVFDEQAAGLFLVLLLAAVTGVLILTLRRKVRQQRGHWR
jgi:Na+-driven multidrug efflux pump